MSRGDHVYVRRRPHYSHHGIDCGDGTVIHYVGERGSVRRIERTSWEEFAAGDEVHVRAYKERLPVDDIVRNAESRLGTEGYRLVTNNCEHFVEWCLHDVARSFQAETALAFPRMLGERIEGALLRMVRRMLAVRIPARVPNRRDLSGRR